MSTVQQIIYDAFRLSGITRYAGRTPSADELTDAQRNLNRMTDSWNTERLMAYSVNRKVYDINPPAASYTLGPDGDWNDTRPVRIEKATLLYYGDTVNYVEMPMRMLTDDEWANVRVKSTPSPIPRLLYNNGNFPLTQIFLYPVPTASNHKLALYVWNPLSAFSNLSDEVNLPPGYEDAVVYNLAVRCHGLWSHGEKTPLDGSVVAEARRLKASLKALNVPDMKMRPECPSSSGRSYYDIYSGEKIIP